MDIIEEKTVDDQMMKSVDEIIAEVVPDNNINKRLKYKKHIILIIHLIVVFIGFIKCCNKTVNATEGDKI